jgi:WD40 repeat protein
VREVVRVEHSRSFRRPGQLVSERKPFEVTAVAFSADGNYLATASSDRSAIVWDGSGRPLTMLRHDVRVSDVAFSPSGRHLATASLDGKARVWALPAIRFAPHGRSSTLIARRSSIAS